MLKLIESKYVREYIEKTGFEFSDMDFATIAYNSDLPIPDKHAKLKEIADNTQNEALKKQIAERIAHDEMCLQQFTENDGTCFYELSAGETTEFIDFDDSLGYFASADLAMKYAKQHGIAYKINKYQIIGLCKNIIVPYGYFNPYTAADCELEDKEYCGEPISSFTYNAEHELCSYWTFEIPQEEKDKVDDWGKFRFEHRFVYMPNPFETGDKVQLIGTNTIAVVGTSQEAWGKFLQRVQENNLPVDYYDASLVVDFIEDDGECGSHGHIQPIYLEKI